MNFKTDFENADRENELLLVIPTGDLEQPIELSVGWWDDEIEGWVGHWQGIEGMEDVQPIAYVDQIEVPEDIIAVATKIASDAGAQPALSEAV